jgi:uncharacterized membrane protein YbhN (UPF0104 family)
MYAIGLTIVLTILVSLILASMLGADFFAVLALHRIYHRFLAIAAASAARIVGWTFAIALLTLCFAIIYYWAPDVKTRRWHWLTPGGNVGILGWLLSFFKQLLDHLWLSRRSDHLTHLVLHNWPYAPCRCRDEQRDRSHRRREPPAKQPSITPPY